MSFVETSFFTERSDYGGLTSSQFLKNFSIQMETSLESLLYDTSLIFYTHIHVL